MAARLVLDASVAGAAFFTEEGSDLARDLLASRRDFIAPDLLFVEIASLASKKVRRGEASTRLAMAALDALGEILSEIVPGKPFAARAFAYAADHGFSAYDGLYLAVADHHGAKVITADMKMYRRAVELGLGHLVAPLNGSDPP